MLTSVVCTAGVTSAACKRLGSPLAGHARSFIEHGRHCVGASSRISPPFPSSFRARCVFHSSTDCRFFSEAVVGAGRLTRAVVCISLSLRSPLVAPLPFHSVPALALLVAVRSAAASAVRPRHRVTLALAHASARAAAAVAAAAAGASPSNCDAMHCVYSDFIRNVQPPHSHSFTFNYLYTWLLDRSSAAPNPRRGSAGRRGRPVGMCRRPPKPLRTRRSSHRPTRSMCVPRIVSLFLSLYFVGIFRVALCCAPLI